MSVHRLERVYRCWSCNARKAAQKLPRGWNVLVDRGYICRACTRQGRARARRIGLR